MSRDKHVKMVMTSLFSAIVVAMTFIPYVGYIRYSVISLEITTLHVIVILSAIILGPVRGMFVGGVWGITSLIYALVFPSLASPAFLNPMVSVIPRIIVGLAAGVIFSFLFKVLKKHISNNNSALFISSIITAICGTLINTALVLTMYNVFGGIMDLGVILSTILKTVIGFNGLIEMVIAIILVPAIGVPLYKYYKKTAAQV